MKMKAPVTFRPIPSTATPPVGHFDFRLDDSCLFLYFVACPSVIFESTWRILTKFCTGVPDGDVPAPDDFWTVPTTLTPPVGDFVLKLSNPCPSIISEVAWSKVVKLYVGLTTRILHSRLKEHGKDSNSALLTHSIVSGHDIAFSTPSILSSDNNRLCLYIREALCIKETGADHSLNRNVGSFNLQLF